MSLKTLKNNYYVILVNPLNHLSSNPCSLTFVKKQCHADLLFPVAGTNGQDLCLDMTVTFGICFFLLTKHTQKVYLTKIKPCCMSLIMSVSSLLLVWYCYPLLLSHLWEIRVLRHSVASLDHFHTVLARGLGWMCLRYHWRCYYKWVVQAFRFRSAYFWQDFLRPTALL